MDVINKQLPYSIIEQILEYYNPYKDYYKKHVLIEIEKTTLGAWYVYDMRDTIRNYIQKEGLMVNRCMYINGIIAGTNTKPSIHDSIWYDYKFIQNNPYK